MKPALILVGLLFLTAMAFGSTWYVPDDFTTIQDAINAAVDNDTIVVRPGTYVENIDFLGKAITVMSESGPDVTVIDGGQPAHPDYASVVIFQSGEGSDSILEGFTLTNGTGTWYGSLNGLGGGGAYGYGTSPTIRGNVIQGNTAGFGGGAFFWGSGGNATISKNMIFNNTATQLHGGGIAFGGDCSITITNNKIFENTSPNNGGAIYGCEADTAVISSNEIYDNVAVYSKGGGIRLSRPGSAIIMNNRICGNTSGDFGGGISGGNGDITIVNNLITDNTAKTDGGGIGLKNYANVTTANNIIAGNSATRGGGIDCNEYSSITITNDTIHGNKASSKGGGIACRQDSSATITNTVLWNNDAVTEGKEIWIGTSALPSTVTISYSDVEGGQASVTVMSGSACNWGAGMLDVNPLLAEPVNGDFHLAWISPCRNTGDNSAVSELYDFEGDPRIADGLVDMGADEFYFHLYHSGDVTPGSPIDVRVVGTPLAPVTLALGAGIQDPPLPTPYGDLYLAIPLMQFNLGAIPASGVLAYPATVPSFWNPGDEKPLQALVGPLGNPDSVLTNLLVLEVE